MRKLFRLYCDAMLQHPTLVVGVQTIISLLLMSSLGLWFSAVVVDALMITGHPTIAMWQVWMVHLSAGLIVLSCIYNCTYILAPRWMMQKLTSVLVRI